LFFALSRFVFFTNFSFLPSRLFVLARYFAFFAAFKMGVKNFRTGTMPMRSQHDALFQIQHDSLFVAEMPSFLRLRQDSLFLPKCRRYFHP
jgi:hypothetical protein